MRRKYLKTAFPAALLGGEGPDSGIAKLATEDRVVEIDTRLSSMALNRTCPTITLYMFF